MMARFYDEIIWSNKITLKKTLIEIKPVVFDISDVAHQFHSYNDFKENKQPHDFKKLKPPYKNIWLESKLSSAYEQYIKKYDGENTIDNLGALITETDIESGFEESLHNTMTKEAVNKIIEQNPYKIVSIIFVIKDKFDEIYEPGTISFLITKKGRPIKYPKNDHEMSMFFNEGKKYEVTDDMTSHISSFCGHLFHSLQMLNCKNVKEKNHSPDPSLAKKQRKTKGSAQTEYKTLVVEVPEKTSSGNGNGDVPSKRQHFVRGHFRHLDSDYFTEEKKGTSVWIPPHVRGSDEEGIVKKDYSVETR